MPGEVKRSPGRVNRTEQPAEVLAYKKILFSERPGEHMFENGQCAPL